MADGSFPYHFDQRVHHLCPNIRRHETPAFELYLQEQIRDALRTLLATRGLYQKVDIEMPDLKTKCGILPNAPAPAPQPGVPILGVPIYGRKRMTEKAAFLEAATRVWEPMLMQSKGSISNGPPLMGDSISSDDASRALIQFYPPSFPAHCETETCNGESVFSLQLAYWDRMGICEPIRYTRNGTKQVWHLYYRCEKCHSFSNVITVKREGLRLQVCGRTERFVPPVHRLVPKELRRIIEDALNAVNENDVFGGFYHLRTFVEHFMKAELGEKPDSKVDGDELCSRYSKGLDPRMKEGLPSFNPIYADLSQRLHARNGERRHFDEILDAIHHHMEAKALFGKYTEKKPT